MRNDFFALAAASLAFSGAAPMGRQTSDPRDNWVPVSDNAALAAARKQAEADRKARHAAKLARRAAQKERSKK